MMNGKDSGFLETVFMFRDFLNLIYNFGNATLQSNADLRQLMNEEQFDLVIVGFFFTDFMLGLADHFKCPSIVYSPSDEFSDLFEMIGNPLTDAKEGFVDRLMDLIVVALKKSSTAYFKSRARQVYK